MATGCSTPMPDLATLPSCALSIRQPWAHHIIYDGKDVENRTWETRFRGPVLVHASKTPDRLAGDLPAGAHLGGIVGVVEIVRCVRRSNSRWFVGPWGFVLRNPRPLPFVPCKGALGFFKVPDEVMEVLANAS